MLEQLDSLAGVAISLVLNSLVDLKAWLGSMDWWSLPRLRDAITRIAVLAEVAATATLISFAIDAKAATVAASDLIRAAILAILTDLM